MKVVGRILLGVLGGSLAGFVVVVLYLLLR